MHVSFKNLLIDVLTILCVILLVENHCRPTNPCKNGGLCVEMDDGYKCRCKGGYKGVDCEGKVYSVECIPGKRNDVLHLQVTQESGISAGIST